MTGADAPRWSTAAQPALGVGRDGRRASGRDGFYHHLLHVSEGSAWLRGATQDLRRTEVMLGGFPARCGDRLLSLS